MASERLIHLPEVEQQVLTEPGASNLSPSEHQAGVCFGCAVSQGSQGILRPCCVDCHTPSSILSRLLPRANPWHRECDPIVTGDTEAQGGQVAQLPVGSGLRVRLVPERPSEAKR